MTNKKNMKKGITLIEIILAIVLIAIILGITIPKLMANSARAEIKAVISSDVKSIVESAVLWKKSNATAGGNFISLSSNSLNTRLPSTMEARLPSQTIASSGLKTGLATHEATAVKYIVSWSFLNPPVVGTTPAGSFAIGMDFEDGVTELGWDVKLRDYAKEIFDNVVHDLSTSNIPFSSAPITPADGFTVSGATVTAGSPNSDGYIMPCDDATKAVCYTEVILN